jgi:hypothetical protein
MSRLLVAAMTAVLCVAAAVAIAIVLTVDSDETASKIGINAFAVLLFGIAAAGGVTAIERPGTPWVGWACLVAAVAGLVVTTVFIWSTGEFSEASEGLWKAFGSLLIAALALAQVSLLARRSERERGRVFVLAAQAAALLLAGLLIGAILAEVEDETYYRWVGVAGVLWLTGTALVPLARRVARA